MATFGSAFSSVMKGGTSINAMKRPTWLGYVYRSSSVTDFTGDGAGGTPSAWANGTSYSVGTVVSVTSGSSTLYYRCLKDHTSASSGDFSKGTNWGTWNLEWATETGYAVNDIVKVTPSSGSAVFYICTSAHTSSGTSIDTSYFTRLSYSSYTLTFVERKDDDASYTVPGTVGEDNVTNYSFGFVPFVVSSTGTVSFKCSSVPTATAAAASLSRLSIDTGLMDAFIADDWETGLKADYDEVRDGTSVSRW